MSDLHAEYLTARRYARNEILGEQCPVPATRGVYGWWFDALPSNVIDTTDCVEQAGLTLLYAGISPSRPPSRQTIRTRIRRHYRGNAAGSTLRLTLGCLLTDELGIELRRKGSGTKRHFGDGERAISQWMSEHAFVSWIEHPEPWHVEKELIETSDLPLNLAGNRSHQFYPVLSKARADMARAADELPVHASMRAGHRYD